MSRFARISVRKSAKATSFVAGYIGAIDPSGHPLFEMPGGVTIPLRGTWQAISANHATADAFRIEGGSLFSIAAKDVRTDRYQSGDHKRPIETVSELLKRNPWNNAMAKKLVVLLDS